LAIERHLDALLKGTAPFVVVHWDLAHFKAFNDEYGFAAGDEMIQMTANLLRGGIDPYSDFVGHVGGDDFVQVLMEAPWLPRLEAMAQAFDLAVNGLFRTEHVTAGGIEGLDRQGRACFHPLVSLRGGALPVEAGHFPNARALASAMTSARKEAKRLSGRSGIFVERRRLGAAQAHPLHPSNRATPPLGELHACPQASP
jgi:GGDEF domain-containing protein